jgi:hypothetical protein
MTKMTDWSSIDSSHEFVALAPFKPHLGDLLGDKSHHENQDRGRKQKRAHIGKSAPR